MTATDRWAWARHWTDLLGQDEVWRDAQGSILRLDDMEPGYCGRVRAFILRQADAVYDLIGMQACAGPDDMSEQASIDFDRAFGDFLDQGDNPRAWLERQPLLLALSHRAAGRPARSADPVPSTPATEQDDDPFGSYEYVEPRERCHGAEGRCTWGQCGQRRDSCQCRCAQCRRQTSSAPRVELRDRCLGYQHHEDEDDWDRCTGRRGTCRCGCPACCGDTPDVWGAPVY